MQGETLTQLRRFRRAGLLVLAVDYLTDATKVADFCARARAEGFVPLAAVRALDRLPPSAAVASKSPLFRILLESLHRLRRRE